jgi:hypothetical protein
MSQNVVNSYRFVSDGYPDGNCINGTETNIDVETTIKPDFAEGSYDFNGTSSKVTIADSLGTTAFTISAWVLTIEATGNHSIYGQLGLGLNLYMGGSSQIRCSQGGGGSQLVGSAMSVDTWYNVIFTKTAGVGDGVAKLYLDNNLEDTETDWSDFETSQTSLISGHQSDWWKGFITDFAIWNTVISSGIRDEINAGSGALISSLSDKENITTYYPFTSLDGSTVTNVACP